MLLTVPLICRSASSASTTSAAASLVETARAGFHRLAEVIDGEHEGAGPPAQLGQQVHDALALGRVVGVLEVAGRAEGVDDDQGQRQVEPGRGCSRPPAWAVSASLAEIAVVLEVRAVLDPGERQLVEV